MGEYTNKKEYTGRNGQKDDNLDGSKVMCKLKVLGASGQWSALGPDVGGVGGSIYGSDFPYAFVDSYKYGVTFQITVTGQIGIFDPYKFINAVVVFIVLLSLAPIVASFVAMYLLGAKSMIFRSLAEQSVERKMQVQAAVREELRARKTELD